MATKCQTVRQMTHCLPDRPKELRARLKFGHSRTSRICLVKCIEKGKRLLFVETIAKDNIRDGGKDGTRDAPKDDENM